MPPPSPAFIRSLALPLPLCCTSAIDASDASYHFTIPSSGSCDSARIEPLVATTESGDMVYAVPLLPKYWVEIAMKMRWTNSEEEGNA